MGTGRLPANNYWTALFFDKAVLQHKTMMFDDMTNEPMGTEGEETTEVTETPEMPAEETGEAAA